MSGKKRPILTVIIILGIAGLFLGVLMTIILTFFGPSTNLSFGNKIGVIPIEGPIMESRSIVSQLVNFRKNKGIKAIILRIDSPGGGVGPSQEIYREVRRTIKTKKVIINIDPAYLLSYYTHHPKKIEFSRWPDPIYTIQPKCGLHIPK